MKKHLAKTIFIFTIAASGVFCAVDALAASSLLDYENRVARAAEQVERIRTDAAYVEEGIESIKTLLPRAEQVEVKGRTVDVNNTWLHVKLDAYLVEQDNLQKRSMLDEVAGYLRSLDQHLIAAEDISKEALRKAELQERLREILADDKYREKRDGPLTALIKKVKQKISEILVKIRDKIFGALYGAGVEAGWLFKTLVGIAIGAALLLIVRMILKNRGPQKKKKKRTVLGEEIEEDAQPSDLADAAMAAARAGDFRLGVRKLYIAFLYELSEKGLIELEANATNWEYLTKVSRFSTLAQPMRYLTDRFDYFWYGMFPSSATDFESFLSKYKEAVSHAKAINEQTTQIT